MIAAMVVPFCLVYFDFGSLQFAVKIIMARRRTTNKPAYKIQLIYVTIFSSIWFPSTARASVGSSRAQVSRRT